MPSKGIDTSAGPEMIGDDFVVDAQNYRFRDGDWTQRNGYALYDSDPVAASTPITGIVQALLTGGTAFLVCTGTDIYKNAAGVWTSVKGALTLNGSGSNLNSFCVLNDHVIGTNGKNPLWKYNAATDPAVVLGGTPPATSVALLTYYNRVLSLAADGTLSWCTINNPDDWTSSSAGSAAPGINTGQTGIGLGTIGEDGFLFMSGSIWQFNYTGTSTAPHVFRMKDPVTGCAGRQSIVAVPDRGMLFFANYQGIYMMQAPAYSPVRVSRQLDGVGGVWSTVNKTRLGFISAARHPSKSEVWFACSLSGASTNALVLVYDYDRQTWTKFVGIAASTLANVEDGNGDVRVYHGDYGGYVYNNDSGTCDNPAGTATLIDAYATSKAYPLVDGYNEARVRVLRVFFDQQTAAGDLEVGYGYDLAGISKTKLVPQGAAGALWDAAIWDVDTWPVLLQKKHDVPVDGQGHHFQFQIRSRTLNILSRIYKVGMGVKSSAGGQE